MRIEEGLSTGDRVIIPLSLVWGFSCPWSWAFQDNSHPSTFHRIHSAHGKTPTLCFCSLFPQRFVLLYTHNYIDKPTNEISVSLLTDNQISLNVCISENPPHLPAKWAISLHCYILGTLNCVCYWTGTQLKFVKCLKEKTVCFSLPSWGISYLYTVFFKDLPSPVSLLSASLDLFWSDELSHRKI